MSKMIILQGLPASGKSLRAKELVESMGNAVRINKDLLRTMLHFDKWSGRNEENTRDAAKWLAAGYLGKGINVIIDETNLSEKTFQSWKEVAKTCEAKIQIIKIDVPIEECVKRDAKRDISVGHSVIWGMAFRAGLHTPKKGYVLCDLDGTLAKIDHRLHFVRQEPKDWKNFFSGIRDDEPRWDVGYQVIDLKDVGYDIVFVSARPDTYRQETEAWIARHFSPLEDCPVLMRGGGDTRQDDIVKQNMLDTHFKDKKIYRVFDDRPRVIRMWQKNGLDVVDVGPGIEF